MEAAREQRRGVGGISRRAATRLAWSLWALSLTLTALSLLLLALIRSHPNTHIFDWWFNNTLVVVDVTVGAIVASRRPENPVGWLICLSGLAVSIGHFTSQYAIYALLAQPDSLPAGEALAWMASWLLPIYVGLQVFYLLLFPTGRLPSRRWRSVAWLTVAFVLMGVILSAFSSDAYLGSLGPIRNPRGIEGLTDVYKAVLYTMAPLLFGAAALSLFMRLRWAAGVERQQLKWFAYAAAMFALGIVLIVIPLAIDTPRWFEWGGLAFFTAAGTAIPISIGIAILRYRLYDIDLIINRTLVYGALTASVVGIYVLVVGYLGALFQTGGNLLVSLLATGVVAVLFQPLRDRLQRGVNRLMYGERDDPYAVVSRLGERLEATLAPDTVLPTIVETVREALKLPYAAIVLTENSTVPRVAASVGEPVAQPLRLPLTYQSEPVGELLLGPRAPGEPFSSADWHLLEGLARQAGVAGYAVRLTTDLQRSRERLVAAREEERRRLRRDLHDGLGAQLAALNVQVGTLRRLIGHDPEAAEGLVVELREELRAAIADIRRLVYDLRPPALDELGLIAALHQLAERYGSEGGQLRVSVEAPEDLPSLPAAVEVAIYRIVQEALTNVARHARAQSCVVQLVVKEDVALEIVDDGVGIPQERGAGVGLSSMRERAAELGGSCALEPALKGGTRVLVRLPLPTGGPKE
jgi:signal transduction histidine kinase